RYLKEGQPPRFAEELRPQHDDHLHLIIQPATRTPPKSVAMPSIDVEAKLSIRDQWARAHAIKAIKEDWKQFLHLFPHGTAPSFGSDERDLPSSPFPKVPPPFYPPPKPVVIDIGIVGAGIAGLFAAKVLDYLNLELCIKALGSGRHRGPTPTLDEFYND